MSNYHTPHGPTFVSIHDRAWALVSEAEDAGIVLKIESVSLHPLAMGNTMMMVHLRPARLREKMIYRMGIEAMATEALERVNRRIAEQCEFEKNEVREYFDIAFFDADGRTHRDALDAMRRQSRAWPVKPFQRYRRTA